VGVLEELAKQWIARLFQSGRYTSQYLWLFTLCGVAWYFGTETPDKPGTDTAIRWVCVAGMAIGFAFIFGIILVDAYERWTSKSHAAGSGERPPVLEDAPRGIPSSEIVTAKPAMAQPDLVVPDQVLSGMPDQSMLDQMTGSRNAPPKPRRKPNANPPAR
jgi:hypothetical protein